VYVVFAQEGQRGLDLFVMHASMPESGAVSFQLKRRNLFGK